MMLLKKRLAARVAVAALVLLPLAATAETIVLQHGLNGYSGTTDTSIFADNPNNSSGGFPWLYAGDTQFNSHRRTLIKFDMFSQVPAGSVVTTASLSLYCDQARPGLQPASLHLLTSGWTEGNKQLPLGDPGGDGLLADPHDTTWAWRSYNTVAWTTPGGTFEAAPSASGAVGEAGSYLTLTGAGLVQDVQNMVNSPLTNLGWILLVNETATWNAKRFYSSEAVDSRRPALLIEYTPPASVAAWQLY